MANPVMRRLMRELKEMNQHPVREFRAMPLEDNMFEWHFTMQGPPDSPYAEGLYHGKILVGTKYPFEPPDVVLCTPNGRFELEKKICLSISSYHPENWQSTWGLSTVLHALRSFMVTPGNSGIGAIEYPAETRIALAKESRTFKCSVCERSSAEDWEAMKSSPCATEADMKAPVAVATPMMTPTASMGTPQNSSSPNTSTGGGGVGNISPAMNATLPPSTFSLAQAAAETKKQQQRQEQQQEEEEKNKKKENEDSTFQLPPSASSQTKKPQEGETEQQQQQQQQAVPQEPVQPNIPAPPRLPPPMNRQQQRRRQQQQGIGARFVGLNNQRLEIRLSLELLDKLVAIVALMLGMFITFRLAVSIADPETVAGRMFDTIVAAGLDMLEGTGGK